MTDTMCGGKFDTGLMMRSAGSLHVSHVSRADDEESGPPEFMCHMWMRERPPPMGVRPGEWAWLRWGAV